MPVNLSIKNVPDEVADRLRARAAGNRRSLQRELMVIIEEAVEHVARQNSPRERGERERRPAPGRPIDDVIADLHKLFPGVRRRGPAATEIIREMRDGRPTASSGIGRRGGAD